MEKYEVYVGGHSVEVKGSPEIVRIIGQALNTLNDTIDNSKFEGVEEYWTSLGMDEQDYLSVLENLFTTIPSDFDQEDKSEDIVGVELKRGDWEVIMDNLNTSMETLQDVWWNEYTNVPLEKLVSEGEQLWEENVRMITMSYSTGIEKYNRGIVNTIDHTLWNAGGDRVLEWTVYEDVITFYFDGETGDVDRGKFEEMGDFDSYIIPFPTFHIKVTPPFVFHVLRR